MFLFSNLVAAALDNQPDVLQLLRCIQGTILVGTFRSSSTNERRLMKRVPADDRNLSKFYRNAESRWKYRPARAGSVIPSFVPLH